MGRTPLVTSGGVLFFVDTQPLPVLLLLHNNTGYNMDVQRGEYWDLAPGDSLEGFDIVQMKHDGEWSYMKIAAGVFTVYSRLNRVIETGVIRTTATATLVGEWMPAQSVRAQRDKTVGHFYAFDMVGEGLLKTRLANLDVLIGALGCDWIKCVRSYDVSQWESLWEAHVLTGEREGLVFKTSNGCPAQGIGRMKREITVDLVCMGFLYNKKGTFRSIRSGMYIDGELTEVCKVPVYSQGEKAAFAENPDAYIGNVFEVIGNEVFPSGAVRHARYPRWRDDKRAEECIHHG